jgi:hypothetical protein
MLDTFTGSTLLILQQYLFFSSAREIEYPAMPFYLQGRRPCLELEAVFMVVMMA